MYPLPAEDSVEWLQPPEYKLTLSRRYYLQRKDKPPSRRSPLPPEKTLLRSAPPEYKQLQSDPRSLSSGSRKKKKKNPQRWIPVSARTLCTAASRDLYLGESIKATAETYQMYVLLRLFYLLASPTQTSMLANLTSFMSVREAYRERKVPWIDVDVVP